MSDNLQIVVTEKETPLELIWGRFLFKSRQAKAYRTFLLLRLLTSVANMSRSFGNRYETSSSLSWPLL